MDLSRFPMDLDGFLACGFVLISLLSTKPSFEPFGAHGHDQIKLYGVKSSSGQDRMTSFDKKSQASGPKFVF